MGGAAGYETSMGGAAGYETMNTRTRTCNSHPITSESMHYYELATKKSFQQVEQEAAYPIAYPIPISLYNERHSNPDSVSHACNSCKI